LWEFGVVALLELTNPPEKRHKLAEPTISAIRTGVADDEEQPPH
jgi:hypothetical protein